MTTLAITVILGALSIVYLSIRFVFCSVYKTEANVAWVKCADHTIWKTYCPERWVEFKNIYDSYDSMEVQCLKLWRGSFDEMYPFYHERLDAKMIEIEQQSKTKEAIYGEGSSV
jgi:hypothetical protein